MERRPGVSWLFVEQNMAQHLGYPGPPSYGRAVRVKRQRRYAKLERREGEFGAPRRYGIGTLLIVTAAAAGLLGFFNLFGAPPALVAVVLAFLALVALGQLILYQGVRPRAASVITGAVVFPVGILLFATLFATQSGGVRYRDLLFIVVFCIFVCPGIGALLGYVGGGMVAGIFLVMDAVERKFAKPVEAEIVDEEISPLQSDESDAANANVHLQSDTVSENRAAQSERIHPLDR